MINAGHSWELAAVALIYFTIKFLKSGNERVQCLRFTVLKDHQRDKDTNETINNNCIKTINNNCFQRQQGPALGPRTYMGNTRG